MSSSSDQNQNQNQNHSHANNHTQLGVSTMGRRKRQHSKTNMEHVTLKVLERLEDDSVFFDQNQPYALPSFANSEVELISTELGRGEFGVAFAVAALHVIDACPCLSCSTESLSREREPERERATQKQNQHKQQQQQQVQVQSKGHQQETLPRLTPADTTSSSSLSNSATTTTATTATNTTNTTATTQEAATTTTIATTTIITGIHTVQNPIHRRNNSRISFAEDVKLPDQEVHNQNHQNNQNLQNIQNQNNQNQNPAHNVRNHADGGDDDSSTLSTEEDDDSILFDEMVFNNSSNGSGDGEVAFWRGYMSTHVVRHGRPRYAIKRLRDDLKLKLDASHRLEAAVDLAVEAKFLATIRHPNIVKMRGTVGNPGTLDFMIVMDCLVCTLTEKMNEWNDEAQKGRTKGWLGRILQNHQHKEVLLQDQYADKLLAMYDIARAMRYLHNQSIIFRDLKPENVAFDIRGDMRLFDFGLAKELKAKDLAANTNNNGTNEYNATGLTGSRRYMAPEVVLCKPYSFSADVYSYSIVFWEVFSGQAAYPKLNLDKHFEQIVLKEKRPSRRACNTLPKTLVQMMQDMWGGTPNQRPNFKSVCDQLGSEYVLSHDHVTNGNDSNLSNKTHMSDRTNYLMNRSLRSRAESMGAGEDSVNSRISRSA